MTKSRGINRPAHRWTWVEEELMRTCYADSLSSDIAKALGLSVDQVHRKANLMGLQKSVQTIAEIARQRAMESDCGHRFGFQKGNVPANKGVRRPGWAAGRMRETQFRKGQLPSTWKPIGSLRINADGYLDRKVSDTGYPPRDWQAVHRLVWVAANGPIPKGHAVCFKPGLRTTVEAEITLDRIELLSRRQLLDRNSVHRLPSDLKQVVVLSGVLTRQINKRSKENQS